MPGKFISLHVHISREVHEMLVPKGYVFVHPWYTRCIKYLPRQAPLDHIKAMIAKPVHVHHLHHLFHIHRVYLLTWKPLVRIRRMLLSRQSFICGATLQTQHAPALCNHAITQSAILQFCNTHYFSMVEACHDCSRHHVSRLKNSE